MFAGIVGSGIPTSTPADTRVAEKNGTGNRGCRPSIAIEPDRALITPAIGGAELSTVIAIASVSPDS